ncbi:putative potassium channel tetramerization-type BTB domain, SKP1/BTB/POZ domain superfamily [Plasmopara halstedii]
MASQENSKTSILQVHDDNHSVNVLSEHNSSSNTDGKLSIFINPVLDPRQSEIHHDMIDTHSVTLSSMHSVLPVLVRATSQEIQVDHTVGRTRVPWHSKSVSDLRNVLAKNPTRIVAFDVGGKLFRCKESLIAKYPLKRLNQIIACNCGKSSCLDDAFYIDRNPQHFEMILDWYRTKKLVRQRNVDEQAFKNDAIYFDLYEELFQSLPAGEALLWPSTTSTFDGFSRRRSVNDVDLIGTPSKRVSMFANMASSPLQVSKNDGLSFIQVNDKSEQDVQLPTSRNENILRFFRQETRKLTLSSVPLVFVIPSFEQLLVERIQGRGILMVRVCDPMDIQQVQISEAVLFDSQSSLDLMQYIALLPGDHVYTFWITEPSTGSNANIVHSSNPIALEITFKIIFTFESKDRISDTLEMELARTTLKCHDLICTLSSKRNSKRSESCLPISSFKLKEFSSLSNGPINSKVSPLHKTKLEIHGNQKATIRNVGGSSMCQDPRIEKENGTVYRPEDVEMYCTDKHGTLHELQPQCDEKKLATYHFR